MSEAQWTTQDYLYVTAECVTGVLSLLGNALVLVAIMKSRGLRTITNCFIGSLAAADALVGLIIPPTTILSYTGLPRDFYGCVIVNSLVVLITNISILSLLAVALERFLAVSRPFLYQRMMTINRALLVLAVTWVIAILIGLIPLMGWHLSKEGFEVCAFIFVIDLKYMVYLIFFGETVPLLLAMLFIYLYIFYIIHKQQQRTKALLHPVMSREMRNNMRLRKNEVRGAKGLAYVIILFAVCWLPIHIMNCITVFAPEKSAPYSWLLVAIVLSHANSVVNPFLYAFSNSKFKHSMKRLLCCGRGVPYDYDSTAESTQLRTKRTANYDERSSQFDSVAFGALGTEPTQHRAEELLNTRHAASQAPVSWASTPVWTSTSAANPSPSKEMVCNGNGTHAGKTLPEHGHLNQRKVTDNSCEEDNAVQFHRKKKTPSTVTTVTDTDSNISHTIDSGNLWMTTSSKCVGIEQHHYLKKKESSVDSSSKAKKDKKSRIGENVFDRPTGESEQVSTDSSVEMSWSVSSENMCRTKSSNVLSVRL